MAILLEIKKALFLPFKKASQKNMEDIIQKTSRVKELLLATDRVHLGCGDVKKKGFINVDFRTTLATDISHDCSDLSIFPEQSLKYVFSNAFFEHLYKNDRVKCLTSIYRTLRPDGSVIFVGFPDFEKVARAYLEKRKGLLNDTFNLYEVYRFTHGDPEHVDGWWLEQLHKSLFDKAEMENLLLKAGFKHFIIFDYAFRQDDLVITMGFVAFKEKPEYDLNKEWLANHIPEFSTDVRVDSIEVLSVRN
jgi:predicted SAM-dependent methyltransferase